MTRHLSKLAHPLTQKQVSAANEFHAGLPRWRLSDEALFRLRDRIPEWDQPACLLKSAAINTLYGTKVYAVIPMAEHIARILAAPRKDRPSGDDLVESIARLPISSRVFISFASKFCHFFIDPDVFPIFDEAARQVLKYHLGAGLYAEDQSRPYATFGENLRRLREVSKISCNHRELDHYLWITGLYRNWLSEKAINVELRSVLDNPSQSQIRQLDTFLPPGLERRFLTSGHALTSAG
jgi:hypothetical protein